MACWESVMFLRRDRVEAAKRRTESPEKAATAAHEDKSPHA
jgi:hypothetical protein